MYSLPRASIAIVLWQLLFSSSSIAQTDSAITFEPTGAVPKTRESPRTLEGILTVSAGLYHGFDRDELTTFLQPGAGFEFLARPGGWMNLLAGVKLGFSKPLTTGVHVGIRQPFYEKSDCSAMIFGDVALLFFDDADRLGPIGFGVRGVVGGRAGWFTTFEYRLAGEYRGMGGRNADGTDPRGLWWVGAEAGVVFTLGSAVTPFSRIDSVRAAIQFIATSEELDEFDALRSTLAIEEWLDRFWMKRDVTLGTPLNEARIEYEKRVRVANERFSRPRRLGIDTDPGRVLALYNEPDAKEMEYSIYDANYRYELWIYRNRVRHAPIALFLFVVGGPREWQQIYSNVPGEMTGPIPNDLPLRMRSWF